MSDSNLYDEFPEESADADVVIVREGDEDVGEMKHKHRSGFWGMLWGILLLVLIIFLALWLFSLYSKWKMMKYAEQHGYVSNGQTGARGLGLPSRSIPAGAPLMIPAAATQPAISRPMMSYLPGFSSSAPQSVVIPSPTHSLMVPNSPINLSPEFDNDLSLHRVHLFYDDASDKDNIKLYKKYKRLRDRCQKKDFAQTYGPVSFSKCDINDEKGRRFYKSITVDGAIPSSRRAPMMTFAKAGDLNEKVVSTPKTGDKETMQNIINEIPSNN